MSSSLEITLLDPSSPTWAEDVDHLRRTLGAPDNPALFPPHYLKTTLPRIGGHILSIQVDGRLAAVGFAFPRAVNELGREYSLRLHRTEPAATLDLHRLAGQIEALLDAGRVVIYDPLEVHPFHRTGQQVGDVEIGSPDRGEALAIRALQQRIWRSEPDFLYPVDIHTADFGIGISLVARYSGQLAGFLFGFHMFDGPEMPAVWLVRTDWRMESQVLGVAPEYRGRGIAVLLKARQAELARQAGIDLVHWTADPLQFGNAVLNFGRLRAVATAFYPDCYAFRNELNLAPASRLRITWLVDSRRVRTALARATKSTLFDLSVMTEIRKVNQGWSSCHLDEDAPRIAFEIPANWTALQRESPDQALRWREATDRLFQHYLDCQPGRYIITGVGIDGERRYLVAEQVTPVLLEELGATKPP